MAQQKSSNPLKLWLIWIGSSTALISWMAYAMLQSNDQSLFMPGPLTGGHHQLELACNTCHSDPLGGGEVLQQACVDCHGDDRKKPFDSHPASKFNDPRNADRLENINALECTSCHTEHQPDITANNGLTQPVDFCFHCHSDIGDDRPSHQGMPFDSCKDSGCHNFHNNRALYTDFLVKHLHEPPTLEKARLPDREFGGILDEIMEYPRDRYPVQPLGEEDMDAPASAVAEPTKADWLASSHAQAGVNCTACHMVTTAEGEDTEWTDHPGQRGCDQCHSLELERFGKGKHGMRSAAGLEPMTPADAQLPMHKDAAHRELTCNSCHPAHGFETRQAAVDACLDCHADQHSLAYKDSLHYALWQKELSGEAPQGSGVSCASCHMPRVNYDVSDWLSRIMVDHNQNATLSPNSKMIRPACLHCHGLGFAIDALADTALIESNFRGQPSVHVESMELAERDHQRALEETAALENN
jgi:predicted CXXCH cytochrome family protein